MGASGVVDVRTVEKHTYIGKEDTSSPTISTEALFMSCTIDATEERDVATVDILGMFMQSDMEGEVDMRLEGTMAELFTKLDPKSYIKYICTEKGKALLCARLKKALYGIVQVSLLFWKKLSGILQEWGFELNPYDRYVANQIVNGKQCTIPWHVSKYHMLTIK